MSIIFPSNPATQTPTNEFSPTSTPDSTSNGVSYTWDGEKWVASGDSGGGGGEYLPLSGGDLTGDLGVDGNITVTGDVTLDNWNSDNTPGVFLSSDLPDVGKVLAKGNGADVTAIGVCKDSNGENNLVISLKGNGSITADGSAIFAGGVETTPTGAVNGYYAQINTTDAAKACFTGRNSASGGRVFRGINAADNTTTTSEIFENGSAEFAGRITINSPNTPLIAKRDIGRSDSAVLVRFQNNVGDAQKFFTDGSASFAGPIVAGNWDGTGGTNSGASVSSAGGFFARRPTGSGTQKILSGYEGTSENVTITASGSSTFADNGTFGPYNVSSNNGTGVQVNSGGVVRVQRGSSAGGSTVFQGYVGNTETSKINADGSASFGTNAAWADATLGSRRSKSGWSLSVGVDSSVTNPSGQLIACGATAPTTKCFQVERNHQSLGGSGANQTIAFDWMGNADFDGTVTSSNSFAIQLEADDDTKYTTTTEDYVEQETYTGPLGNSLTRDVTKTREIRTYNGAVLDVKERIQNVISRMDAMEANEVTDDATDSALLTLVANLSSRLDERDLQIAALTARITTLELP